MANEAARQRFRQGASDEERSCLLKYGDESDIGLYRALAQFRQPLCFDELVGNGFRPQEHPASVTCTDDRGGISDVLGISTAMSGHAMRGGRHFVEFTTASDGSLPPVYLGVIRPVSLINGIDLEAKWRGSVHPVLVSSSFKPAVSEKLRSQRTAKWGDNSINCCTYFCNNGSCFWTDWSNERGSSGWQGHEGLTGSGTIGLLLDLDEGTLTVFMNGRQLGVMKDGLGGEYVWFVSVFAACTISISRGQAPN